MHRRKDSHPLSGIRRDARQRSGVVLRASYLVSRARWENCYTPLVMRKLLSECSCGYSSLIPRSTIRLALPPMMLRPIVPSWKISASHSRCVAPTLLGAFILTIAPIALPVHYTGWREYCRPQAAGHLLHSSPDEGSPTSGKFGRRKFDLATPGRRLA